MADDQTQRPSRAPDSAGRTGPSGNDPLAELARLIGQSDPFAEFGREGARQAGQQGAAPQRAPSEPAADWTPPAGSVSGYAPAHPAEPVHPQAVPHQPPEYTQADLYRTEVPPHAEAGAYAQHAAAYGQQAETGAYEPHYDDPAMAHYAAEDQDYYDDVPPRRRMSILAIAAVFALAVIGTAGAFGYRALFGSGPPGPPPVIKADTAPSKVVPPKKDSTAKLIQDRAPQPEKLVTREEKPVDLQDKPVGVFPQNQINAPAGTVQPAIPGSGVIGAAPKTVHTITIRPDQPNGVAATPPASPAPAASAAPPAAAPAAQPAQPAQPAHTVHPAPARPTHTAAPVHTAPRPQHRVAAAPAPAPANAPLSLSPNAAPVRTAPARRAPERVASAPGRIEPQTAQTGGYGVQVSSRRSRADAEAAFRRLQGKYPNQLGSRQPLIRRVDLGSKGIYYRAMVGPFSSRDAASKVCSRLKAAGGSCFVQRI